MKAIGLALTLVATMLLSSCDRIEEFRREQSLAAAGRLYQANLLRLLQQSGRVVVTEHASSLESSSDKPNIYSTIELSREQIAQFSKIIENLSPDAAPGQPLCFFEGHHTIKFYRVNAIPEQMDICFKCGQIEWSGATGRVPKALIDGLADFINSIGMSAKRDWAALAKAHAKGTSRDKL
jgi:hypothetical protein